MAVSEGEVELATRRAAEPYPQAVKVGPIGRLGRFTATHFRAVVAAWVVVAVGLGVLAPRVETALSGAGWETAGSQSVQARRANLGTMPGREHRVATYAPPRVDDGLRPPHPR